MELFSFMRRPPRRCDGCNFANDVSDASDVLRWLVVALALSFFAMILACSREDTAGSPPVTASLSINAAITDLGQRDGQKGTNPTALSAESESSVSSRRVSATGIESLYAGTDGDAALDFVGVCDQNTPCIVHPSKSSSKTTYSHPLWAALSLAAAQDTEGEPVAEIIVLAMSTDRGVICVCVIRD